jgi:hypothetical protein
LILKLSRNEQVGKRGWLDIGSTLARFIASPQGLGRAGHKVGIMYITDNPQTAARGTAFVAEAQALGFDVHVEKITTNQTTFTAQLQRLRDAGVDTVAMICVFESVGILRDAKAIAFNLYGRGRCSTPTKSQPAVPNADNTWKSDGPSSDFR